MLKNVCVAERVCQRLQSDFLKHYPSLQVNYFNISIPTPFLVSLSTGAFTFILVYVADCAYARTVKRYVMLKTF